VEAAKQLRIDLLDEDLFKSLERYAILRVIDEHWKDHLYGMGALKEGVGLRAYGQKDPLIEYKKEGFELFQDMLDSVNVEALRIVFRASPVSDNGPQKPAAQVPTRTPALSYSHADSTGIGFTRAGQQAAEGDGGGPAYSGPEAPRAGKQQPVRVGPQVGRNDPCPCGSGKKFKKCHGATVQSSS
jgi:preprotein translocase subunit SecA